MRSRTLYFFAGVFILAALVQCGESDSVSSETGPNLSKPELLEPEDSSEQLTALSFHWREVEEAKSYQIQLSVAEDFVSALVDHITDSTQLDIEDLPGDTTIYWKVRSVDRNRNGPWSDIYMFTTKPDSGNTQPLTATLKSPPDDARNQEPDVRLSWTIVANASGYALQLATDENFNSLIIDRDVDSTSHKTSALTNGKTYYWRVKPILENKETRWSEIFSFSTRAIDGRHSGGTAKIMPLGNSITEAFGYRIRLWDKLTDAGYSIDYVGSQSSPHSDLPDTDHEGHGGWYIEHISDNVNEWLAKYKPDYILLMIGTNNIAWWTPHNGAEIADAHAKLVDQILANAPSDAWVLVASIPPQSSKNIEPNDVDRAQLTRDFNREMEERMQRRIDNGEQIVFVDMHSRLTVDHLSDGIHPNDRGYEIIARAWFEKLLPVLP